MRSITKAALAVATVFTVMMSSVHGDVSFDVTRIGNPSQPADQTGFGHMPYVYDIATHEVANTQYAEFLNAKYNDLVGRRRCRLSVVQRICGPRTQSFPESRSN